MKRERRRWKRQWFNGSIQVSKGTHHIDGLGIQVSRGGMYLFAIADLPVGSEIKVGFTDPDSGQRIDVAGTIRYRTVYLYGIEFILDESSTSKDPAVFSESSASPS